MPRITKDNPITNYVSRAELNRIREAGARSVAAGRDHNARLSMLNILAGDVSTIDLAHIVKAMPHILTEAVRELHGEVEYVQTIPTKE
jgi:hypothetical protein